MFPEYRKLITSLKGNDAHFDKLFAKHNKLDNDIKNLELKIAPHSEVLILKKEKLLIKDELWSYLSEK
ncbi:DUF465 domain-containing protein [Photobacterium profundum]|uniref:DUF465 domain-containing protein n=1 Tax=Photobacterium profundum 3TCK TaxID=314280 RepID=Q1YYL2_9GAMM|nr:YdcH family protein [Photobacterium profundum]EAS41310.1 hypothetical protein P3TCK_07299 [Photobacterium profundum 3TCK]PSV57535.1 DUF465 domain-containing protein [Photobacterium profundum]